MGIVNYFAKLYNERRSLALITWAYLLIALLSLLIAGILALIDQPLGQSILLLPLLAFLTGTSNIIIWSLIKLCIDTATAPNLKRLENSEKSPKTKK